MKEKKIICASKKFHAIGSKMFKDAREVQMDAAHMISGSKQEKLIGGRGAGNEAGQRGGERRTPRRAQIPPTTTSSGTGSGVRNLRHGRTGAVIPANGCVQGPHSTVRDNKWSRG